MAASDRLTGSNLVVEWTPSGGSLVTITSDFTAFSISRTGDMVDVTAGNETARYYKGTIEDLEFTLTFFNAKQAYLEDLVPLTEGLLSIYDNGKASGEPLQEFNAILGGYNQDEPFDGAIEIEITGKRQGAHTTALGSVVTP